MRIVQMAAGHLVSSDGRHGVASSWLTRWVMGDGRWGNGGDAGQHWGLEGNARVLQMECVCSKRPAHPQLLKDGAGAAAR